MEQNQISPKPFSLPLYLLIVFGLSWPVFIAFVLLLENPFLSVALSSLAMLMVTVGTYICGKFIFRDGYKHMGWSWGMPWHYAAAFGLALIIFGLPVLFENVFGLHTMPAGLAFWPILGAFLAKMVITIVAGFGEEFGWRGYMLPRLVKQHGPRKGLLLHGFIWWFWHLPIVVAIGVRTAEPGTSIWASIAFLIAVTIIPSMMNAVLFAYVWAASQSLAVVSVYHAFYDEVRDVLEQFIGFGPLVSIWEMLATTIFGGILLWKADWKSMINKQP